MNNPLDGREGGMIERKGLKGFVCSLSLSLSLSLNLNF